MRADSGAEDRPSPAEQLRAALAGLHQDAGSPSSREIASGTSGAASHTTVAQVLSGKRVPSWPILQAIVERLGGNPEGLRELWTAATATETAAARLNRAEQEFLARYRQTIAQYHGRLEPPDFERRRRVPLEDVYVEQSMHLLQPGKDRGSSPTALRQFDTRITRTVLLGDPGSGKTTACNVLMYWHAVDENPRVPFLVTVRSFAGTEGPTRSVLAFLEHELEAFYQCPAPPGLVERLLSDGKALVIFDGLDELLDPALSAEVASIIEIFCADFPLSAVLATSRVVGYGQAELDPGQFTAYRLTGFSQEQAVEYARKWFALEEHGAMRDAEDRTSAFLQESVAASDLRSNPLMLALLCILYRGAGSLPRKRAEIYEACADLLFRRWDQRRRIAAADSVGSLAAPILRGIAWWMLTRDLAPSPVTERELTAEVARILSSRGYEHEPGAAGAAAEFVAFIRGRMWVFSDAGTTKDGERLYTFTHRTFLDYFAASHLAYSSDSPESLAGQLAPLLVRPEWETVAELAIHIKDRISDRGTDRVFDALMSREWPPPEYAGVLYFWLQFMAFAGMSPRAVRALAAHALDYAREHPASEDATAITRLLLTDDDEIQPIIADQLAARLGELIDSGTEDVRSSGLQMARMICQVQDDRNQPWRQATQGAPGAAPWKWWCEELNNRYPAIAAGSTRARSATTGGTAPGRGRPPQVDPDVVARIWRLRYESGLSYGQIANLLNADGIRLPGGSRWLRSSVDRVLHTLYSRQVAAKLGLDEH
jgi:transcriptional regulator with XRE-family HTH domain